MCPDCGHPAHAGLCHLPALTEGRWDICPCTTRRNDDGLDTTSERSDGAADALAVDNMEKVAGMEHAGDKVVAEMKRIQGKLDAAFPLLTEFRDRMRALEARR